MSVPLTPISLAPGTIPIRLTTPNLTKALLLANKSIYDLQIIGAEYAGSAEWLPSGVEDLYMPKGRSITGEVDVVVVDNRPANSPVPSSAILLVTQYLSHDTIPDGSYPATIPVQGQIIVADSISNQGNIPGTPIITSVVQGDSPNQAVSLTNDAKFNLGDVLNPGFLAMLGPLDLNIAPVTKNGATAGSINMYALGQGSGLKFTLFTASTNLNQGTTNIDFVLPTAYNIGAIIVTSLPWAGLSVLLSGGVQAIIHDIAHIGTGGSTSVVPGQAIQTAVGAFDTVRFTAVSGAAPTGGIFLVIGV